jgi:hypothetical protein
VEQDVEQVADEDADQEVHELPPVRPDRRPMYSARTIPRIIPSQ